MTFTNYAPNTSNAPSELNLANYKTIVDAYANGKYVTIAAGELFLTSSIVDGVYKDIKEVEAMIGRLMRGESKWVLPTYDEEGNELTPLEYNTVPTTITALKQMALFLVVRDFDNKVKGKYSSMTPEDFSTALNYCIDSIVKWSNGVGDNTFSVFQRYF